MYLSEEFLKEYREMEYQFGFGALSEFVMMSKYSRIKENGQKEEWVDIVQRNVEGLLRLLNKYSPNHSYHTLEKRAESLFQSMYDMIVLPAGRPLVNLGTYIIDEKELGATLNNCAGIDFSKEDDIADAFGFVMDASMCGVGVGINVGISNPPKLYKPLKQPNQTWYVEDTREGWVDTLGYIIRSFLNENRILPDIGYSKIRKEGEPIKGMGGIHTGYKPLKNLFDSIIDTLYNNSEMTSRVIADICNMIGACVVSGGQRRSALLLLGDSYDDEFINLKNYEMYPYRRDFGWTSNNSPYAEIGMSYEHISDKIKKGEDVGLVWINNFRHNGRMGFYEFDDVDVVNPCSEMGLKSRELCNLVEININKITDKNYDEHFYNAVFIAKILSLVPTHWEKTNEIIKKNRRFGIGQTGITQYLSKHGIYKYVESCEKWYRFIQFTDDIISPKMLISTSVKTTTIKPSGSLSLLMGTTAGIHYATSKYIIRRVRVAKATGYHHYFRHKGYKVEQDVYDKNGNTYVIEFPVAYGDETMTIDESSMYDQLNLATLVQRYWSDNGVSTTITFTEDEIKHIGKALNYYQFHLKSVSFLKRGEKLYEQAPEEPITKDQYNRMRRDIVHRSRTTDDTGNHIYKLTDAEPEKFCTTDSCEFPQSLA